nr:TRAP transporter small permease [Salsuginibacillus kocurii]
MKALKKWMDRILLTVSYPLLVILIIGALWQVFTRYVLDNPSIFTEELMTFLLIWISLLGATYAFGTNQHLSLTFIKDRLTGRKKKWIYTFNHTLIMLFSFVVLLWGGISLVISSLTQNSPIMSVPMGYVYLIFPLSGVLIILYQLMHLVDLKDLDTETDIEGSET